MNEKELARHFAQKHLPFKPKWLRACMEYLKRTKGPEIERSEAILQHNILQFLYSKLSDSLEPLMIIPEHATEVMIVKRMIFQMISYTNISVSLYEQLLESTRHKDDLSWFHGIHEDEDNRDLEKDHLFDSNNHHNNSRPQPKKRGMLKLELTDGVNNVKAVELEEIFDESLLVPGVKILLTGKVKCRGGVLLLDNTNCDVLGGRIQTMESDKVKQLSEKLNVDSDDEKKRREESLATAASLVVSWNPKQQKHDKSKNDSMNQSTMSPFLIKTNRKTGEITNPPILTTPVPSIPSRPANPEPPENWDFSIEEVPPPPTPTPQRVPVVERNSINRNEPPVKKLLSLVIEEPRKVLKKNEKVPRIMGNRAFNGTKELGKSERLPQNTKKKSEKDDMTSSRIQSDPATKRHVDDPEIDRKPIFLRTLHGPRQGIEDFRRKVKTPAENTKMTEHFATVKSSISKAKRTGSPPKPVKPIEMVQQKPLHSEEVIFVEDNSSVEETDDVISITPVPPQKQQQIVYHQVEDDEEEEGEKEDIFEDQMDQEEEEDDSIMECTIEQEGRFELEKWGLRGRQRREVEVYQPGNAYNSQLEKQGYSNDHISTLAFEEVTSFPIMRDPRKAPEPAARNVNPQPSLPYIQNRNFPNEKSQSQRQIPSPRLQYPIVKRVKTEPVERRRNSADRNNNVEIRNKQSANVQVYRTPFAKRLASSDSSSTVTNQLFQRMAHLQIVPLADALASRKFWFMPKIIVVMPTICHQVHELRSNGVDWLFQITVTDTSAASIQCRVSTDLLNRLFGFTFQQCKNLFDSNQAEELRAKKRDAAGALAGFKRLDLLIWIEVPPEHSNKIPLIVDVKSISDALNIF